MAKHYLQVRTDDKQLHNTANLAFVDRKAVEVDIGSFGIVVEVLVVQVGTNCSFEQCLAGSVIDVGEWSVRHLVVPAQTGP